MESQYLSIAQAADLLGVNRKTIAAAIAAGLPHQRLGKRVIRIARRDLEQWGRITAAT